MFLLQVVLILPEELVTAIWRIIPGISAQAVFEIAGG